MQTLVEFGPSNASQGQHRRKDATEQMKNLTLARTRTQVPGFSSADALNTNLWMSVAEPEFVSLFAFRSYIHTIAFPSCELFSTCCYFVFFHNLSTADFII